jgi:Xaa-Pro aminopeptidase
VRRARADRTLPLLFAHYLRESGIEVTCEPSMGQAERRSKDAQEVEHLAHAQRVTEDAIRMACELIARCKAGPDGVLIEPDVRDNRPLTSERVKSLIDLFLMERGFTSDGHIVAGGPIGADCHHAGAGVLRTGEPIIVDVFPRDMRTLYHGDCTRMVVHGPESRIAETVRVMHQAVVDAKAAAIGLIRARVSAEAVHRAAIGVIQARGFGIDATSVEAQGGRGGMPHGTGHGLGLDLKEPPLLDFKGPDLVVGDAVTVEPGVYKAGVGGMRIEDLVIVMEGGCRNLNALPEGLTWA